MMLLYLLAATIVQPAVDEPPAALKLSSPPHNYLNLPLVTCGKGNSDEVVVCGSSDADKRYRLHPIDERKYAEAPIRAKTNIGPDTLDVGGKQTTVGGFPSNRVMITFTVPF